MNIFKDKEKAKVAKKLFALFVAILILFSAINAIWFLGYQQRYSHIAKHLDATYIDSDEAIGSDLLRYKKDVDEYTITMKMPAYLGLGGFVSVAKTEGYVVRLDDDGNIIEGSDMYITLYIWPKFFKDYKIGLDFYDEINSVWEQVEFTSEMEMMNTENLDDDYIKYVEELVAKYSDEINELIGVAEKTLEINIRQD